MFSQTPKPDPAIKSAQKYLAKGQVNQAVAVLREAAGRGSASAMGLLGRIYMLGVGIPADLPQAADWIRKGAERGDRESMRNLGFLYGSGSGVPKDDNAALTWYRKAADAGDADAMNDVGGMYLHGTGVPRTMRKRRSGTASRPTMALR